MPSRLMALNRCDLDPRGALPGSENRCSGGPE
jgi:hypothetical protein